MAKPHICDFFMELLNLAIHTYLSILGALGTNRRWNTFDVPKKKKIGWCPLFLVNFVCDFVERRGENHLQVRVCA